MSLKDVRNARWRMVLAPSLLVVVLTISSVAGRSSAQPVSIEPRGYTEFIAKELRLSMPNTPVRVEGPLFLTVDTPMDGQHDLHLDTIYLACSRNAAICAKTMESFVEQVSASYQTPEPPLTRKSLRLAVRMTDHIEGLRQAMAGKGGPAVEALPGGFWLMVVADRPTMMQMLNSQDLSSLGLTAEQALAVARKNMRAQMGREIKKAITDDNHNAVLLAGDAYEAALLAFTDLWAPVAQAHGGELLVSAPAPDVVLCGGKDAGPELIKMAKTVMNNDERPLSPALFRWTPTGWELESPPGRRRR